MKIGSSIKCNGLGMEESGIYFCGICKNVCLNVAKKFGIKVNRKGVHMKKKPKGRCK